MAPSIEDRSGSSEERDPVNELFTLLAEVQLSVPSRTDVERWKQDPLPGVEHCALMMLDGLEDLHRLAAGDLSPQEQRFPSLPRRRAAVALRSLAEHALLQGHLLVPVSPALTAVVADREGIARALVLEQPFPNTIAGILELASTVAIQGLWAMVAGKPQEPQDPPRDIWVALEMALRKLCRCRSNPITRLAHEAIALKWARNWLQDWVGLDRGVWSPLRQRVAAEIDLARLPRERPEGEAPPRAGPSEKDFATICRKDGVLKPSSRKWLEQLPRRTVDDLDGMTKEHARRLSRPMQALRLAAFDESDGRWKRTTLGDETLKLGRLPTT